MFKGIDRDHLEWLVKIDVYCHVFQHEFTLALAANLVDLNWLYAYKYLSLLFQMRCAGSAQLKLQTTVVWGYIGGLGAIEVEGGLVRGERKEA